MLIKDQKNYDGSFIHQRFAYRYFKDSTSPYGNIVAFVSPVKVDTGLIDLEDAMQKDYIYSEKMINFCWEIPFLKDSFGAVAFQRLFNTYIADALNKQIKKSITIDGDDIMVREDDGSLKKASVSITYFNGEATLGHTGVNIVAGSEAPSFAYSTMLNTENAIEFISDVINVFNWAVKDMFVATTKISVPK